MCLRVSSKAKKIKTCRLCDMTQELMKNIKNNAYNRPELQK